MGLTLDELTRRADRESHRIRARLKKHYHLARGLGFTGAEATILQSQKGEVIIQLAIERGLIKDVNDPKTAG